MEKIIFFVLVIPIMAFVLYLGGMAIMNGFKSKEANRAEKEAEQFKDNENLINALSFQALPRVFGIFRYSGIVGFKPKKQV